MKFSLVSCWKQLPEQTSEGDVAREAFKVKDFTYDFSFWSFSKADVHYASQEQASYTFLSLY